MINKKATHVGFMLSFVLFIFTLMFLYLIFQPDLRYNFEKNNILKILNKELIKKTSAELDVITISTDKSVFTHNCFVFIDFLSNTNLGNNLKVQNENHSILLPYISSNGNSLHVDRRPYTNSNFFRIYYSPDFSSASTYSGTPPDCKNFDEGGVNGYIIGHSKTTNEIFESKIISTLAEYYLSYEILKEELKVPESSDFAVQFVYENLTIIGNKSTTDDVNIFVKEIPIQYIDKEANKKPGTLIVSVW